MSGGQVGGGVVHEMQSGFYGQPDCVYSWIIYCLRSPACAGRHGGRPDGGHVHALGQQAGAPGERSLQWKMCKSKGIC